MYELPADDRGRNAGEARPKNHRLREDEILDKEERPEASKSLSRDSEHQIEEEATGQEDVSAEEEVSAQEEVSGQEEVSAQEESEALEEAESSAAVSQLKALDVLLSTSPLVPAH